MNKRYFFSSLSIHTSIIGLMTLLPSCTEESIEADAADVAALEEVIIKAVIGENKSGTRAGAQPDYSTYIGRHEFVANDKMVVTSMKRKENPIAKFSYTNLLFEFSDSQSWNRKVESGQSDKIYWTDKTSGHTFIGYSIPQAMISIEDKWKSTYGIFQGYFTPMADDPATETIDESQFIDFTTNEKISNEDVLLTYNLEQLADEGGSAATLHYQHGLSSIRVVVNIVDFTGSELDTQTKVSNLILLNQPWKYRWNQGSNATELVTDEVKKAIKTWIPKPDGVGSGQNKTFTFQSLIVPGSQSSLSLEFDVTYPDALNPVDGQKITKTYSATLGETVKFSAGHTTTINIKLSHKDEAMTIGALYYEWENEETPNDSELSKNNTYLQSIARTSVTIVGDANATEDDATWLYMDGSTIKDIYGNTGTQSNPFTIKTAEQLLSFAYEVTNGRTFKDQYVKLDADITLQKETDKTKQEGNTSSTASDALSWIGIGASGKPFNGYFDGGSRMINRLYGSPLFYEIGANAHVGQLTLKDAIEISGNGGFAEINNGTICACEVDGNVIERSHQEPVGSIVGTNNGLIFACYHIGDLTATNASVVGGLVGRNGGNGKIVASYNYGKITTKVVAGGQNAWKYGILGENLAASASIFGCFYDKTQAEAGGSHVSNVAPESAISSDYPSEPKTTTQMIVYSFVGDKDATVQRYTDADLEEINSYNGSLQGAVKKDDPLIYTEEQFAKLTNAEISEDMFEFFNCFGLGFGYDEYVAIITEPAYKPPFSEFTDEETNTLLIALKEKCKHNEVSANAFNAKLPGAKKIGDIKDLSLNAIINSWTEDNADAIEEAYGEGWKTHFANHYYVAHPASYPYVY